MRELLEKVLKGEEDEVSLPFSPLAEIIKNLDELGVDTSDNDMDTNGWQVDFWLNYKYNDKKYMLSGSLYYGDMKFGIDVDAEEEDDE